MTRTPLLAHASVHEAEGGAVTNIKDCGYATVIANVYVITALPWHNINVRGCP